MTKDIFVYQGSNYLDIVNNGVGSLNWLIVEGHYFNTECISEINLG